MTDQDYMERALNLAVRGRGKTNPNPMVGAVIVKNGTIIGAGYHQKYGDLHAERQALLNCETSPLGATMYVTLEPCCHYGRQPPCTDAILEAGIARVVIGSADPNPLVSGGGISLLRKSGIEVETGILKEQCDALNQVFFHFIQTKTPYVVMKYAMTMDGKIATKTGASQWITGEPARLRVHADRGFYSAIMVGVGTVLKDDPMLTCRIAEGRNPTRIICDTNLRTPTDSQIVRSAQKIPTIFAAGHPPADKKSALEAAVCRVWELPGGHNQVSLRDLAKRLGAEGIDSVLLEGGAVLNWAALEAGIVQKVQTYLAPKLFGGAAKSPVGGSGVALPAQAIRLKNTVVTPLGDDFLLESEVETDVYRDC